MKYSELGRHTGGPAKAEGLYPWGICYSALVQSGSPQSILYIRNSTPSGEPQPSGHMAW